MNIPCLKQHYVTRTHCLVLDQVSRAVGDSNRRLLFHGWTRLCVHAASLNAVEGASSAATAAARGARAEAEEKRTAAAISATNVVKEDASKEGNFREEELKRRRAKTAVRGPRLAHANVKLPGDGTVETDNNTMDRKCRHPATQPITRFSRTSCLAPLQDILCSVLNSPDHSSMRQPRQNVSVPRVEPPLPTRRVTLCRRRSFSSRYGRRKSCPGSEDSEGDGSRC